MFPPALSFAVAKDLRVRPEMLTAIVQLRQADIDPSVLDGDEIEDFDIEETGFQATYARLVIAVAPSIEIVPFKTVDEAVNNFVVKLAAADGVVGGALLGRIRREVRPEVALLLASWGVIL